MDIYWWITYWVVLLRGSPSEHAREMANQAVEDFEEWEDEPL